MISGVTTEAISLKYLRCVRIQVSFSFINLYLLYRILVFIGSNCDLQVAGSDRSSIILPLSGLKQFHEMVGHFVDITKDQLEGLTGANVRTIEPPQR